MEAPFYVGNRNARNDVSNISYAGDNMLEVKKIHKTYRPKKGVPVAALQNVSIQFPDTGMVFLLGRSGSGKSTLLNLIGGLDKPDEGEILIHGKNVAAFTESQVDSYRNTYIGFVFQDYNVLPEFNVKENVALALYLRGEKADEKRIEDLLEQVDLAGYGLRKTNELSGGQLQRVAIARALVKEPEIILADEPTGALDSNTGKQIFDTLKKLSERKLVIIVSHDRDYSEQYADRIIELADGEIISDVTRTKEACSEPKSVSFSEESGFSLIAGNRLSIPAGKEITDEELTQMNEYLALLEQGNIRNRDERTLVTGADNYTKTDESLQKHEAGEFRRIRSSLPWRKAIPLGLAGLKRKKLRLVLSILLTVVAFALFGVADALSHVNPKRALVDSAKQFGIRDMRFLAYIFSDGSISGLGTDPDSVKAFAEKYETSAMSRYEFYNMYYLPDYPAEALADRNRVDSILYKNCFGSAFEIDGEFVREAGYSLLAGRLPDGTKPEICISKLTADGWIKNDTSGTRTSYEDILGEQITSDNRNATPLTVVGVIDTHFPEEKCRSMISDSPESLSVVARMKDTALRDAFGSLVESSVYVGPGAYRNVMNSEYGLEAMFLSKIEMIDEKGTRVYIESPTSVEEEIGTIQHSTVRYTTCDRIPSEQIIWLTEEPLSGLTDRQVLVSLSFLEEMYGQELGLKYGEVVLQAANEERKLYGAEPKNGARHYTKEQILECFYSHQNSYSVKLSINQNRIIGDTHMSEYSMKLVGIVDNLSGGTETDFFAVNASRGDYLSEYVMGEVKRFTMVIPKSDRVLEKIFQDTFINSDVFYLGDLSFYSIIYDTALMGREICGILRYVGIAAVVFAVLLFASFIANSISYQTREIGVLRALGARSRDVYRIFFTEGGVIGICSFVIACVLTAIAVYLISLMAFAVGVPVFLFRFGWRQMLIILLLTFGVTFVATFLPVYRIAKKKPVDTIRNL